MSYTGYSFYQSTLIGQTNTRLMSAEATLDNKVNVSSYNNKINLVDSSLFTLDARTVALESGTVSVNVFSTTVSTLNAEDISIRNLISTNAGQVETRVQGVESAVSTQFTTVVSSLSGGITNTQNTLNTNITNVQNTLSTSIANVNSTLSNNITSVNDTLGNRIDAIDTSLISINTTLNAVSTTVGGFEVSLLSSVGVTVQGFVTEATFNSIVSSLNDTDSQIFSSLASKVAAEVQNDLDVAQNSTITALDAAITSITSDLSTLSTTLNSDINTLSTTVNTAITNAVSTKLDISTFDSFSTLVATDKSAHDTEYTNYKSTLTGTLGTKLDSSAFSTFNGLYATDKSQLQATDYGWEKRFQAVEEYIRAMSETYVIQNNGTNYTYTADRQNLALSQGQSLFDISSINTISGNYLINLTLSAYAYNSLIGTIDILGNNGSTILTAVNKAAINPTNRTVTLTVPATTVLPITIRYRDTTGNTLSSFSLTSEVYESKTVTYSLEPNYVLFRKSAGWNIDASKSNTWYNVKIVSPLNEGATPDTDGDALLNEQLGGLDLSDNIVEVSGNAVLIQRSGSSNNFSQLALNAETAGAKMIILYNSNPADNGQGETINGAFVLDNSGNVTLVDTSNNTNPAFNITIPIIYVYNSVGQDILTKIRNGELIYANLFYVNDDNNLFNFKNKLTPQALIPSEFYNLVPENYPSSPYGNGQRLEALNYWYRQYFYHTFTAPVSGSVRLYFKYNNFASNNEVINRILDSNSNNIIGTVENLNTNSFSKFTSLPTTDFSSIRYGINSLKFNQTNGFFSSAYVNNTTTPDFILNNLIPGTSYTIEIISDRNDAETQDYTNSPMGKVDAAVKILPSNSNTQITLTYTNIQLENNVVSGNKYIVDNFENYVISGTTIYPRNVWTPSNSFNGNFSSRILTNRNIDINTPSVFSTVLSIKPARSDTIDVSGILNTQLQTFKDALATNASNVNFTNGAAVRYQKSFTFTQPYVLNFNWRVQSSDLTNVNKNDTAFLVLYTFNNNVPIHTIYPVASSLSNGSGLTNYSGRYSLTLQPGTYSLGFACFNEEDIPIYASSDNIEFFFDNIELNILQNPPVISYTGGPFIVTRNQAITPITPTSTGGVVERYEMNSGSVLPAELTINPTTGVISGTPTVSAAATNYVIRAINNGGSATATVNVTVQDGLPVIAYTSPVVLSQGVAMTPISPTSTGGPITSYDPISPALPTGLSFNQTSGVISGTPSVTLSATNFTVTARNAVGTGTATINITVSSGPINTSYPGSPFFVTGTIAITNINPTNNGGTPTTFAVKSGSSLPTGLSLNGSTGVISGTPDDVSNDTTVNTIIVASHSTSSQEISLTFLVQKGPVVQAVLDNFSTPITNNWSRPAAVNGVEVADNTITYLDPANQSITTNTMYIKAGAPLPDMQTTLGIANMNIFNAALSTLPASDREWSNGGSVKLNNTFAVTDSTTSLGFNWRAVSDDFGSGSWNDAIFAVIYNTTSSTTTAYPITYSNDSIPRVNGNNKFGAFSVNLPTGTYSIGFASINESGGDNINDSWTPTLYTGVINTLSDVRKYVAKYTIPTVLNGGEQYTFTPLAFGSTSLTSVSISSALPTGLSLNTTTGVISGRPTQVRSNTTYTVSFTNISGVFTTDITFAVQDVIPQFSYSTPITSAIQGISINSSSTNTPLTPNITRGIIQSFSVSPSFPNGLIFNSSTGVISGRPLEQRVSQIYTITATNTLSQTSSTIFTFAVNALTNIPISTSTLLENFNSYTAIDNPIRVNGAPTNATDFITSGNWRNTVDGFDGTNLYPPAHIQNTYIDINAQGSLSNCLRVLGVGYQSIIPETLINLSYSDVQNATPGGVNDKALWKAGAVRYNRSFTISQNANLSFNWRVKSQDLISSQANDVAFIALHTITPTNVTTSLNPIAFSLDSVINTIEYSGTYNLSLGPGTYSFSFVVYNEQPSTAGNDNYNDAGNINLWIDNITVVTLTAPNISYAISSVTVVANEPIRPIVATNVGGPAIFTVSPTLPTGLSINASTGEITGAATTSQSSTQYTITANNATNSPSTAVISIIVLESNIIMLDDIEIPLTVNSNIYNKTLPDKNYKFRGSTYVYATSATKIRVRVDGTEYAISPTDEASLRFGGVFQGPSPVDPKAYFFDLTTLSDPSGSILSLTSLSDSNGGDGLYLVGIVDRLADNVGSAYTTYTYQKSQIVAVKLNNFSLIGAAVQGWGTDVVLTNQSNYEYIANNIQFTNEQPFKIRSNNKWSSGAITAGYAVYVDIEAINGTIISGNGNTDISFTQPSDKYNVVLDISNINLPSLSILKSAPSITYSTPIVTFTDTMPITELTPTNTGGSVTTYSISPDLPSGLSLDTTTGAISGTPSAITPAADYTITATNTNANSVTQTGTFVINITVQALPVPSIVYSTPKTYYINAPIATLEPTNSGGGNATYSVSPSLPAGLSINSSSGNITGTPTELTVAADYTVTATNITGSSTFAINIQIVAQPAGQPYFQVAWGKWFDGVDSDYSYINTIAIDSQQNAYTMGETRGAVDPVLQGVLGSKPSGDIGLYFIKYDSSGNPLWGKWIDDTSYDEAKGIAVDSADNVYVLGKCGRNNSYIQSIVGSAKPNPNTEGGYIAKFNSSGTPIWAKWIEGTNSMFGNSLTVDSTNNIYVVGQATAQFSDSALASVMGARPSGINSIPFIFKLNSSGVPQWGKWMVSNSNYFGYGFGVTTDIAGNVYIVGESNGDLTTALMSVMEVKPVAQFNSAGFIYKFSSAGNGLWGKWFDAIDSRPNAAYTVATDNLANVYVSGKVSDNMLGEVGTLIGNKPSIDNAGFLVKFGANGTGLWAKWFDGQTFWDDTRAVAVDKVTNQVYVGGFTESTNLTNVVDASGQPLLITKSDTSRAAYILKYAADGTGLYGSWLGHSGSNVYALNVDSVGNLYVSGFNPGVQPSLAGFIDAKSTSGTSASFLFKYKPSNVRQSTTPQNSTNVQIYDDGPNSPFIKAFINHPNPEAPEYYTISINSFLGRNIFPGPDFSVAKSFNFYRPGTDITNPSKVTDVVNMFGNIFADNLASRYIYELSGNIVICNIPKSIIDESYLLNSSDNSFNFNPRIATIYEIVSFNNIWNYMQYSSVFYKPYVLSNYTFPVLNPVENLSYSIDTSDNIVINFDISGASALIPWLTPAQYEVVMNINNVNNVYSAGSSSMEVFRGKSRVGNNVQLMVNRYKFEFMNSYDTTIASTLSISNLSLNAYYRRYIGTDKLSSASITDISYNVLSPAIDFTLGGILNPLYQYGQVNNGRPKAEEAFGMPGNISWRTVYYSADLDLFFGEYWAPNKYRMFKIGPGGGLIRGQGRTKDQLAHPALALNIFYEDYALLANGQPIPNLTLLSSDTMASPFTVSVANGKYVVAGIENATIYLVKGSTYTFNVNATGHPFLIKTNVSTGLTNQYNSGVTNNGAESGTVTFVVPSDAPSELYYNCQYHSTMRGKIVIVNSGSNYVAPVTDTII